MIQKKNLKPDLLVKCTELRLSHHNQNNSSGFVLGNGVSRLEIDASKLLDCGTVYGCNAIYREFSPHYLISVDTKMINEIVETGYHTTHEVWTNPNRGLTTKKHLNFFNPHRGWSSGPTALWFACTQHHREIFILGFDYQGTHGKFNNVYADTKNYKKSSEAATYFGNWLNQTESVIREHRHIKFVRVIEENAFIPDLLESLPNLTHISYVDFINKFPTSQITNQLKTPHYNAVI